MKHPGELWERKPCSLRVVLLYKPVSIFPFLSPEEWIITQGLIVKCFPLFQHEDISLLEASFSRLWSRISISTLTLPAQYIYFPTWARTWRSLFLSILWWGEQRSFCISGWTHPSISGRCQHMNHLSEPTWTSLHYSHWTFGGFIVFGPIYPGVLVQNNCVVLLSSRSVLFTGNYGTFQPQTAAHVYAWSDLKLFYPNIM